MKIFFVCFIVLLMTNICLSQVPDYWQIEKMNDNLQNTNRELKSIKRSIQHSNYLKQKEQNIQFEKENYDTIKFLINQAKKGKASAAYELARFYEMGGDNTQAYTWYMVAQEYGMKFHWKMLVLLKVKISHADAASAQIFCKKWIKRYPHNKIQIKRKRSAAFLIIQSKKFRQWLSDTNQTKSFYKLTESERLNVVDKYKEFINTTSESL